MSVRPRLTIFMSVPIVVLLGPNYFLARRSNAFSLTLQYLNLPQHRNNLLSSRPLLRHEFFLSRLFFSIYVVQKMPARSEDRRILNKMAPHT